MPWCGVKQREADLLPDAAADFRAPPPVYTCYVVFMRWQNDDTHVYTFVPFVRHLPMNLYVADATTGC